jgi:hypothetical protein
MQITVKMVNALIIINMEVHMVMILMIKTLLTGATADQFTVNSPW